MRTKIGISRRAIGWTAMVATAAIVTGVGQAGALPAASAGNGWPMFRQGPAHLGVGPGKAIGTQNAATLTPSWTASLSSSSDTSPAVVTDPSTGRQVVYVGGKSGTLSAFSASSGRLLWSYTEPGTGGSIDSSPAVYGGVVYFGSSSGTVYALAESNGALDCTFDAGTQGIQTSPAVVAASDGSGPIVYIGSGSHGGESAIYGVGNTHGACTEEWFFNGFSVAPGGTWSSSAVGVDADRETLVVFGSKDDDDSVYALDAATGSLVWRYRTSTLKEQDVGASPLISAPGANGIADGAVYVEGKDCILYALNLTTGTVLWTSSLATRAGFCVSSAALSGSTLVVGSDQGVYGFAAATGVQLWHALSGTSVPASPTITGGHGAQIVLVAGFAGGLWALSLSSGAVLWTGTPSSSGYYASPTVAGSRIYDVDLSGVLRTFVPA